jgi:hypothetical protein
MTHPVPGYWSRVHDYWTDISNPRRWWCPADWGLWHCLWNSDLYRRDY